MHYVVADDSVPFDGYTSGRRALGGAEKALANLAAALAGRGHTVTVLNRTPHMVLADGVRYQPIDDMTQRPAEADVLIAARQPHLLGIVRKVRHRFLWVTAAPDYLSAPANDPLWESFAPTVLFVSDHQRRAYRGALPSHVVAPAAGKAFYETGIGVPAKLQPSEPLEEPVPVPLHAVVTTHPLHGLVWMTEIWRRLIHPQCPEARLAIYSAALAKGNRGEEVAANIRPVLEHVKMAAEANVVIIDPRNDAGMADVYRTSRIHFYPGHAQDFACWTLLESQTAGTPAVARSIGGTDDCVINGQTGFLVPDAAAVANVALQLLQNEAVYHSMSTAAGDPLRRRTWETAAAEVDAIVAATPAT
jgi:hypothetical protein